MPQKLCEHLDYNVDDIQFHECHWVAMQNLPVGSRFPVISGSKVLPWHTTVKQKKLPMLVYHWALQGYNNSAWNRQNNEITVSDLRQGCDCESCCNAFLYFQYSPFLLSTNNLLVILSHCVSFQCTGDYFLSKSQNWPNQSYKINVWLSIWRNFSHSLFCELCWFYSLKCQSSPPPNPQGALILE